MYLMWKLDSQLLEIVFLIWSRDIIPNRGKRSKKQNPADFSGGCTFQHVDHFPLPFWDSGDISIVAPVPPLHDVHGDWPRHHSRKTFLPNFYRRIESKVLSWLLPTLARYLAASALHNSPRNNDVNLTMRCPAPKISYKGSCVYAQGGIVT